MIAVTRRQSYVYVSWTVQCFHLDEDGATTAEKVGCTKEKLKVPFERKGKREKKAKQVQRNKQRRERKGMNDATQTYKPGTVNNVSYPVTPPEQLTLGICEYLDFFINTGKNNTKAFWGEHRQHTQQRTTTTSCLKTELR